MTDKTEVRVSGLSAKYATADLDAAYSSPAYLSRMPEERWLFRLHLPDGSAAEFGTLLRSDRVAGHVANLSLALQALHDEAHRDR